MTVPTSCRIVFSFTALSFTGCTVAHAVIREHGSVFRAGHGTIALITVVIAAVSIHNIQPYDPALDRATESLLCAAIDACPLVKFETLSAALRPPAILLPYASRCIIITWALIFLEIMTLAVPMKGYKARMFSSVLLFSVALEVTLPSSTQYGNSTLDQ